MRSLDDTLVIQAGHTNRVSLRELWLYRELLYFFAWRDIKVRYKQTALGAGWAILQPLLAAAIFTLFFNRVARIGSGSSNIPYPVFAYLGLMYWNAFSGGLSTVSNSLISNVGVINKVYFPRLIPPLSATALSVVDFCFACVVFFLLLAAYRILPGWEGVLLIIPSLILCMLAAFAIGLVFASLNVKYRDVRSALPYLIQIAFFMTPVIYPLSLIPQRFQIYAFLNPATGAISSVKAGIFHQPINWAGLLISWLSALAFLAIGLWYFKRTEKKLPDYL
jgi:lipopolysaccharide transport system permease protein